MDSKLLMIGDWVYEGSNHPIKVNQNYGKSIRYDEGDYSHEVEGSCLSPIPLTPEILEKNGFIYRDLPFELYWEYDGVTIDCGACDYYYINLGNNRSMDVSNVHELQHALRLCGLNELADNFKV